MARGLSLLFYRVWIKISFHNQADNTYDTKTAVRINLILKIPKEGVLSQCRTRILFKFQAQIFIQYKSIEGFHGLWRKVWSNATESIALKVLRIISQVNLEFPAKCSVEIATHANDLTIFISLFLSVCVVIGAILMEKSVWLWNGTHIEMIYARKFNRTRERS